MRSSERKRQKRRRHHAARSRRPAEGSVAGTNAAAVTAGVSRRTLGRRVAKGELSVSVDADGRLRFATSELAEVRLRRAGRPKATMDAAVVLAVRSRAQGASLRSIASQLELAQVPTAHGGRRWWASSVRHLLECAGENDAPPNGQPRERDRTDAVDPVLAMQDHRE